jgi:hypothetical protein
LRVRPSRRRSREGRGAARGDRVTPRVTTPNDEFKALERAAYALGFDHIAAGPLVRSSYDADTHIEQDRPGVGPLVATA